MTERYAAGGHPRRTPPRPPQAREPWPVACPPRRAPGRLAAIGALLGLATFALGPLALAAAGLAVVVRWAVRR